MTNGENAISTEQIEPRILLIRGRRVLLDADLAKLYGTSTKALNQAVKRNAKRFPSEFVFVLSAVEKNEVIETFAHLRRLKYSSSLPFAFTEHGAIMAATVLNTASAIETSLFIVRAFLKLRETLALHRELSAKLTELERKVGAHDEAINALIDTIRQMMAPLNTDTRHRIGFHPCKEE